MVDDVLVRCENVSKVFCKDLKKSLWYGVKDIVRDFNGSASHPGCSEDISLRPHEFLANKDISFELKRGECLGIIGGNGAGKTTLLKMLNGLIKPDSGHIEMKGRIGALIALGAGFNPILTGRENIYVNGSILSLSRKEIDDKLDEIVYFSELESFLDTPVRNYSSGMKVRLGFSVATILLEPDVLILDEVLAVGDAKFKIKCLNAIVGRLSGCAVIFVSHNELQLKRVCNRGLLLNGGECVLDSDDIESVINKYNFEDMQSDQGNWFGILEVIGFSFETDEANCLSAEICLKSESPLGQARFGFILTTVGGDHVFSYEFEVPTIDQGKNTFNFELSGEVKYYGQLKLNVLILGEDARVLLRGVAVKTIFFLSSPISKSNVYIDSKKVFVGKGK